jgi:hypothetical protein
MEAGRAAHSAGDACLTVWCVEALIFKPLNSAHKNRVRAGVWACACRLSFPCLRSLAILILAGALLTPFFSGLILFAQVDRCGCGIACCKTAKVSCCRRPRQNAGTTGAHWVNLPGCPTGCGPNIGLPSPLSAALAAESGDSGPTTVTSYLRLPARPPDTRRGAGFALFERPPPSFPVSRS